MSEKKRIEEWEREFQIQILDMDGFNQRDPHLYERFFTKSEFEVAIASCTIAHKRATNNRSVAGHNASYTAKSVVKEKYNSPKPERDYFQKRMIHFVRSKKAYIAFTIPALFTFLLWHFYSIVMNKIQIRWYWPLGFCFITMFIILLEPITPLMAGPLFIWYLLFSGIAMVAGQLYWQLAHVLFHRSLPAILNEPFLSTVNLFGNPVSLYFSIGKALTSSIVLSILIVCIRDLTRRFTNRKSAS